MATGYRVEVLSWRKWVCAQSETALYASEDGAQLFIDRIASRLYEAEVAAAKGKPLKFRIVPVPVDLPAWRNPEL